jgi:hypothetical protein
MRKIFALSFIIISIQLLFTNWGFLVHRTVHQLAVYELPKPMRNFFFANRQNLVENAPRPDQRRSKDSTEAPKHFIDLEAYYDFKDLSTYNIPYTWEEAVKRYSVDTLYKYGYVPYVIVTMKERLTSAFRSGNKDSILFYAADIGHYIGDINVPLHTTLNYDGQLTGQNGIHALWESVVPELMLDQYNLYSTHRSTYIADPGKAAWECIMRTYPLVSDMLQKEREVSKGFTDSTKYRIQVRRGREVKYYTSEFAKAYAKSLGNSINEQLIRSADMIADFWYTAWVDAGKPNLDAITANWSKEQKKNYKTEFKAWKKNELLQKKLLISKNQSATEN